MLLFKKNPIFLYSLQHFTVLWNNRINYLHIQRRTKKEEYLPAPFFRTTQNLEKCTSLKTLLSKKKKKVKVFFLQLPVLNSWHVLSSPEPLQQPFFSPFEEYEQKGSEHPWCIITGFSTRGGGLRLGSVPLSPTESRLLKKHSDRAAGQIRSLAE